MYTFHFYHVWFHPDIRLHRLYVYIGSRRTIEENVTNQDDLHLTSPTAICIWAAVFLRTRCRFERSNNKKKKHFVSAPNTDNLHCFNCWKSKKRNWINIVVAYCAWFMCITASEMRTARAEHGDVSRDTGPSWHHDFFVNRVTFKWRSRTSSSHPTPCCVYLVRVGSLLSSWKELYFE